MPPLEPRCVGVSSVTPLTALLLRGDVFQLCPRQAVLAGAPAEHE